jgi:hypothetical protein
VLGHDIVRTFNARQDDVACACAGARQASIVFCQAGEVAQSGGSSITCAERRPGGGRVVSMRVVGA